MTRRGGDWHLLGFPGDPVPASPSDVQQIANKYRDRADDLRRVRNSLADAKPVSWRGSASARFGAQTQLVLSDLDKAIRTCVEAESALRAHAGPVGQARAETFAALQRVGRAEAERRHVALARRPAPGAEQWLIYQFERAVRERIQLDNEIEAAQRQARNAVDVLESAARSTANSLASFMLDLTRKVFGLDGLMQLPDALRRGFFQIFHPRDAKGLWIKGQRGGKGMSLLERYLAGRQNRNWYARPGFKTTSKVAGRLGTGLGVLGAGYEGYNAGTEQWNKDAKDHTISKHERGMRAGVVGATTAAGTYALAAEGASLGLAIGMPFGPVGMAAGVVVGGVVGGIIGSQAGKLIGKGLAAPLGKVDEAAHKVKDVGKKVGGFVKKAKFW